MTYKCEVVINDLEMMWVRYWSVGTIRSLTRAAHRVAHVMKSMVASNTEHLFAIVTKAGETHAVTRGADKPKHVIPTEKPDINITLLNVMVYILLSFSTLYARDFVNIITNLSQY